MTVVAGGATGLASVKRRVLARQTRWIRGPFLADESNPQPSFESRSARQPAKADSGAEQGRMAMLCHADTPLPGPASPPPSPSPEQQLRADLETVIAYAMALEEEMGIVEPRWEEPLEEWGCVGPPTTDEEWFPRDAVDLADLQRQLEEAAAEAKAAQRKCWMIHTLIREEEIRRAWAAMHQRRSKRAWRAPTSKQLLVASDSGTEATMLVGESPTADPPGPSETVPPPPATPKRRRSR